MLMVMLITLVSAGYCKVISLVDFDRQRDDLQRHVLFRDPLVHTFQQQHNGRLVFLFPATGSPRLNQMRFSEPPSVSTVSGEIRFGLYEKMNSCCLFPFRYSSVIKESHKGR